MKRDRDVIREVLIQVEALSEQEPAYAPPFTSGSPAFSHSGTPPRNQ